MATQTSAPSSSHPSSGRPSSSFSLDEGRFLPGTLLASRYRIVALVGRGGMGEVYRAKDLKLGQSVAPKFSRKLPPLTKRCGRAFILRSASPDRCRIPNVCRVYDLGDVEGQVCLSMEYVDGEDLGSLLRRIGRLPDAKALEISRLAWRL